MAQGVVEALELVQVHVQHRDHASLGPALAPPEGVSQTVQEKRPVGQAGQRIVEGLMDELVLERLALGEVLEHKPHLHE